jgi:hypothetical protein
VSDYLERDENYEPVTLPSPGELLHWGDLHGDPPPPSTVPQDGDFTRFVRRRSLGRTVVAAIVSVAAVGGGAWGIASLTGAGGPQGVGMYFAALGATAAGIAVIIGVWRWANRRKLALPRL